MHRIRAFVMIVALVLFAASAHAGAEGPVRLSVRIFQIPVEQSFEVARPDGRGGAMTLHVRGDVAARFPHGTIFIPTEMAANASDSGIGEAIVHAVTFGCGDLIADRVSFRELKSCEFELDAGHPAGETRFGEGRREGRTDNYELQVERLSGGPEKPVVRLRFDAGSSWTAGSMAGGMSWRVISTVTEVPDSKLLLIGAPGEKAVYVLAICALPR